jgi:hypothetical protein
MHHLAAFRAQLAISANYAAIAGVADAALPINAAGQFILPSNMKVLGAFAQGGTLSRVQIQAPSLRSLAFPEINPIQETANDPAVTNANYRPFGDSGPNLMANESLALAGSNSSGAAVVEAVAGLWIAPRFVAAPPGPIYTLVATTTNVLVADSWTLSTLAFETVLAAGRYSVVGLAVVCDDANLARLVFPGATNLRPGCLVVPATGGNQRYDQFRVGNTGEFGQFEFNAPPQLEILGHTAGPEAATVFMDVVKVR